MGDDYVVVDFETTTEYKGSPLVDSNRIIMASWQTSDGAMRSVFGNEYNQSELVEACEKASFIVAHNAKFELGWLRRCGLDLRKLVVYDTLIGEHVLGGNRFGLQMLGLNACLKRYSLEPKGDVISKMFKAGITTTDMPESWLLTYCERDVAACHELFLLQRQALRDNGMAHIHYQRCLLTPALADIEFNGMQLDEEPVDAAMSELEDEYAKQTAALQAFMGGVPPSSTKQKGEFVYGTLKFRVPKDKGKPMLTPSGTPSIATPVIQRLKAHTPRQQQWLDMHKSWALMHSDLTKYLRKFKDCCSEAGGALRASFNQCATRTHRLSSSGLEYKVQFQNLNRKFKPIFKARNEGWLMGEADGAQLEFRIAAHLGKDKQALADIMSKKDIHKMSASIIGVSRQDAKRHTFKPLFGGTSGTDKEREYYKAFADRYKDITATQRQWTHTVLNTKRLVTEYGMTFYWPGCKMTQSGWITHTTNIHNYPVQGFATAEIIPCAIICAWHRMKDCESFLVNTVHDSIIGEIHPDEQDLWHEVGQQCLIDDCYDLLGKLYNIKLTVPLGAGVMIGTHWSDDDAKASEVVYDADEIFYKKNAMEVGML
jgi:DNA polymerase I-like protein with 3'-5' exonuclease and polymerase domains